MKHVLIVVHSECYNDLRYGCGCSCSIIMRRDISWVFFSRPVANKERNIKSTDATGWYSYLDVYTKLHRNVSVSQRLQHIWSTLSSGLHRQHHRKPLVIIILYDSVVSHLCVHVHVST